VSLRAHTDRLEILADSHVQVASVNGEITIQAKSRIELTGGDSQVVLDGQNITFTTPGAFTVKAASHAWEGAASNAADLKPLPIGALAIPTTSVSLDHRYHDDTGVAQADYELLLADGSKRTGTLDANGRTTIDGLTADPVEVRYGPSALGYQQADTTPMPKHDPAPSDDKLARLVDAYGASLADEGTGSEA
jgi:type VI secretion system secreted protein VgrG